MNFLLSYFSFSTILLTLPGLSMLQIIMAKPAGGPKRDPAAGMDED